MKLPTMRGFNLTSPQYSIVPCQNHALWASGDIFDKPILLL